MRSCTGSSCSKTSLRRHERHGHKVPVSRDSCLVSFVSFVLKDTDDRPRRRNPRQSLRRAPHAPAGALSAPVLAPGRPLVRRHHRRRRGAARAALPDESGDRSLHRHRPACAARPPGGAVLRHPRRRLRGRLPPDVDDAADGAEADVRPADGAVCPSAAARSEVLRPQPGRPPDDARHVRRGRPERSLHVRRRHGVRRRVHPRRHHGRDAVDELAAGAGRLLRAAAHRADHAVVPAQRPRIVSRRPRLDRADQRLPAGEHHRHVDGADVPAGGAELLAVRRDRSQASGREHRVYFLLRAVLPGGGSRERARVGAHHLVRRRHGAARHADARRAGGVSSVRAAILPADQRHVGEVQRAAVGDGVVRADLHAARRAGRGPSPGAAIPRPLPAAGHIVFENVSFAYNTRTPRTHGHNGSEGHEGPTTF